MAKLVAAKSIALRRLAVELVAQRQNAIAQSFELSH